MTFSQTNIDHLFPTPFVTAALAPEVSAEINSQLTEIVLKKLEESKELSVSTSGCWRSDDRLLEWGGEPVQTIVASLKELLTQITFCMHDMHFRPANIDWRIKAWADVHRKRYSNVMQMHPGSYWTAIYYAVAEEEDPKNPKGGDIELLDPRGVMPLLYCPWLRFGIKGYITAGMSEIRAPKAGQYFIFPSWLTYSLRPYIGDSTHISMTFNFSVPE